MTVFADSRCLLNYHQQDLHLLTPVVTYIAAEVPMNKTVAEILRSNRAARFRNFVSRDDANVSQFGCSLLFTLRMQYASPAYNTR